MTLELPVVARDSILAAEVVALLVMLALCVVAWRGIDLDRMVPRFIPQPLRSRLQAVGADFVQGLQALRSSRQALMAVTWSLVAWGLFAVSVALFLRASGLDGLPWYAPLLVIIVTNLGSAIPSSPGFVGGFHFLAVAARAFWSIPKSEALGFAILLHGLNYVLVTALGALALWREGIAFGQLRKRARGAPLVPQEPG